MKAAALTLALLCGPAFGAVVAEVVNGQVRVELHDQSGHCQNGALLALWTEPGGQLTGCWKAVGDVIQIAWSDADISQIPVRAFKPLRMAL